MYKSREFFMYSFSTIDATCYISIYPQQKWEYIGRREKDNAIRLHRKNTTIVIPMNDFEKYWVECK